jgi:hypothetical protein
VGRTAEPDGEEGLVESQGVNTESSSAGGHDPDDEPPEAGRVPQPDDPGTSGTHSEEMVGLPDQRPGYPGQQRTMDTS